MDTTRIERRKFSYGQLSAAAITLAAIIWLLGKAVTDIAGIANLLILLLLVVAFIFFRRGQRQRRFERLFAKYGDAIVVQRIMGRQYWQGQTAEQLMDSIGGPLSIDNKVMATRKRQVWKYQRTGRNRYALRITLDNDVVVGWDQKN